MSAPAESSGLKWTGLPEGVQRLLKLASAVPPKDSDKKAKQPSLLERVGVYTISSFSSAKEPLSFIGETFLAFIRFITGRASYRRTDLFIFIQDCGAKALPIVTLISVLIGLILAFVGAVQLEMFGAQIYVANLVGLGMAREMGAMMTGHYYGRPYRSRICCPDRHHAGQRGDRCPANHGDLSHGFSGYAKDDCPDRDDAAVMSVCESHGYSRAECLWV